MASTYSTNLAIELIGTGDQAGSWGNTTNTNLGTLIEQAISGYVTQAVSTGTDTTITIPNGATGVARNMYIELTGTGGTNTNLIVPANKKLYFIFNNSTGAVTVKVSGQTGVSVPQGKKVVLTSNGTDIVNGLNYIADFGSNSATITQLTATSATITNLTLTSLVISNLSIASANITTLTSSSATISTTLALSGGTANGVLYLNGSKVATSGSTLTFDGTTLVNTGPLKVGNGAASNTSRLMVNNATNTATGIQLFQDGIESWIMGMPANSAGLAWSASGAEQMRLNSTGLGIGTTSPAYKLDVTGTSTTALSAAGFTNNSSANNTTKTIGVALRLSDTVGFVKEAAFVTAYPDQSNVLGAGLSFATRTADATPNEKMRLDSSGNLGIGTASPGALLHVSNASAKVRIGLTATNQYTDIYRDNATGYTIYNAAQAATFRGHIFQLGGTEAFRIDSSGNLGIGTTSPAAKLDVNGAGVVRGFLTATDAIKLGGNTSAPATTDAFIYRPADNTLAFGTASAEKMRLDSSGNLGLGVTPNGSYKLQVNGGGLLTGLNVSTGGANNTANTATFDTDGAGVARFYSRGANTSTVGSFQWRLQSSNGSVDTQAMTLDASGRLGIGTTSPGYRLETAGTQNNNDIVITNTTTSSSLRMQSVDAYGAVFVTGNYPLMLGTNNTERARITSGGEFLVGRTSTIGSSFLCVQGGPIGWVGTNSGVDGTYIDWLVCASYAANTSEQHRVRASISGTAGNSGIQFMISDGGGASTQTESFRINRTSCTVVGSLSKGSGSFKIDHPLKPDTHHLVHSFIEGPQADLIYRGKATLVNGRAEVNIDTAAGMTEGTFVALCREVQCFTSNESDWDAVRGSVSGNKLTIECQNQSSSAVISWLVIGERQDKHMYDTDWTDENGKVIVEPKK